MSATAVRVERYGPVAVVTLDGAECLNAVSLETLVKARRVIEQQAADDDVLAIVLTGAGKGFCAGADLSGVVDSDPQELLDAANALITTIRTARAPVVAAVNGPAVGYGASLVAAADLAIAAESAYVLLTFTKIGAVPDGGLTHTLRAAVGAALAADMALTGRRLSAPEAQAAGLVSRVVPDGECLAAARSMAAEVASRPRNAIALTKQLLQSDDAAALAAALEQEGRHQVDLLGRTDFADRTEGFRR